MHVPFVGLLGLYDPFKGLPAQPLCGREIRMPCAGDIPSGPLRESNTSNNQQSSKKSGKNVVSDHGLDYKVRTGLPAIL